MLTQTALITTLMFSALAWMYVELKLALAGDVRPAIPSHSAAARYTRRAARANGTS